MEPATLDLSSQGLTELPESENIGSEVRKLDLDFNEFSVLPAPALRHFPNVTELNLCGNVLRELPDAIASLRHLECLRLDENSLTALPDSICQLAQLRSLSIVGNGITRLPEALGRGLASLEVLLADENGLELLPDSLCSLGRLRLLQASQHAMRRLPEAFGDLAALESVDLSGGALEALPASCSRLARLRCLDVSDNKLAELLPSGTASGHCLRVVRASGNDIVRMPAWLDELVAAEELDVASNHTQGCPFGERFAERCQRLERLLIGANSIERLPASFGRLRRLRYLHMGSVISEMDRWGYDNGNWIAELPDSFGELESLERLEAHETRLRALPESFGALARLRHLDLTNSLMACLPASFHRLGALALLKLSRNRLRALPERFGELRCLEELYLDDNAIEALPASMEGLRTLRILDLFKNELRRYPDVLRRMPQVQELDLSANPFFGELPEGAADVNRIVRRACGAPSRWKSQAAVSNAAAAAAAADADGSVADGGDWGCWDEQPRLRDTHAQALARERLAEQQKQQQHQHDDDGDDNDDKAEGVVREVPVSEAVADDWGDVGWSCVGEFTDNHSAASTKDTLSSDGDDSDVTADGCDFGATTTTTGAGGGGVLFGTLYELSGDYVENINLPGDIRCYLVRDSDAGFPSCTFCRPPGVALAFKDCHWEPSNGDGCDSNGNCAVRSKQRGEMRVLQPRYLDLRAGIYWNVDDDGKWEPCATRSFEDAGGGGDDDDGDGGVGEDWSCRRYRESVGAAGDAGMAASAIEPHPIDQDWSPEDNT